MSRWLLLAQVLLLTAACGGGGGGGGDDDDSSVGVNEDDQTPLGGVLGFVNAVPDSPAIVIDYEGHNPEESLADPAGSVTLNFGEGSSFSTTRGTYEIEIHFTQPSGEKAVLAQFVDDDAIEIEQDDEVFLVLVGTLEEARVVRIDNEDFLFDIPVEDDGSLPVVDPEFQLMHAGVGLNELDFYLTAGGVSLTRATPTATLGFGEHTPIFDLDARTDYRLRITPAGAPATVLYDSKEFTAAESTRQLVVAFNFFGPGGGEVQAKTIRNAAASFPEEELPNAFRFNNLVADVSAVDLYFGDTSGEPVFAGVEFGELTDYLVLDLEGSEEESVNVTPTGVDNEFIYQGRHTLQTGVANTLLVAGLLSDAANDGDRTIAGALTVDDNRPNASAIQFRAYHGAASAESLDIYVLAPGQTTAGRDPQFEGFSLGDTSNTTVEPGEHDLVIVDAGSDGTLVGPERIVLSGGSIYTLTVTDVAGGGTPLVWRLNATSTLPD
jgi:hypothetical protein